MPETRFCRACGAPFSAGGRYESDAPISPLAQTLPLAGEGRATDGLNADDQRPNAHGTSKVSRAEMDQILRRVQAEYAGLDEIPKAAQDSVETTAPQPTMRLAPELVATAPASNSSSMPAMPAAFASPSAQALQPASTARTRRLWPVAVVALLCVGLAGGVWALVHSRRASPTNAASASPSPTSDQLQLDSEKADEAEAAEAQAAPQQVVKPVPSPAIVASNMEHPRDTRAQQQQVNAPKVSEQSASVSPTPRATPTPAMTTNAAQIDADAFYFKGLNMVNGRDPKSLNDGELNAALNYFLRAQAGTHSAEAKRNAERLGKEFDRRRKKG
jgi:hypothetical protein